MRDKTTYRSRESEKSANQRRDKCRSPFRRTNDPVADGHFNGRQIQDRSWINNLDRNENRRGTEEQHSNTRYSTFRGCYSANRNEFREHYRDNQSPFEEYIVDASTCQTRTHHSSDRNHRNSRERTFMSDASISHTKTLNCRDIICSNKYRSERINSFDTGFDLDRRNNAVTGSSPLYSNDDDKEYDSYMRNDHLIDQHKYQETRRRSTSVDRDDTRLGKYKRNPDTSVRYYVPCEKDFFGDKKLHRNIETDYENRIKRSQRWTYGTSETIFMTQNYLLGRSTDYKKELVAEILNICLDINRKNIPLLYLRETVREKIDVDFEDLNVLCELLTHHDECFIVHDTMFDEATVTAKTDVRLCIAFATPAGCNDNRCRFLHICRFYILGNSCDIRDCKFGHSLSSRHNSIVLEEHQLQRSSQRNLRKLITDIDSRNSTTLPIICKFYQNEGNCKYGNNCIHMHVCRHFIIGDCKFPNCKRDHKFNSGQPYQVLAKIGILCNGNSFQLRRLLNESLLENDQKPNLKPRILAKPTTTNKRKYSELDDTPDDEMNERNEERKETHFNHNVSLRKSNARNRSDALPENRYFTLEQPVHEKHLSTLNGTRSSKQETTSVTVGIQTAGKANELHSASTFQSSAHKKKNKNKKERRSKRKKTVNIVNNSEENFAGNDRKNEEDPVNLEPEDVGEVPTLASDKECKVIESNADWSHNQIRMATNKLDQYIPILSNREDVAVKIQKAEQPKDLLNHDET